MSDDFQPECGHEDHLPAGVLHTTVNSEACARTAGMFSALGDANRLRIVLLLSRGEMCVSELTEALDDNLPAVSQRLKLLRGERIVRTRREGKHVFYALADQHVADLVRNALAHAVE